MTSPDLFNLDAVTLTPLVRALLNKSMAEVQHWQIIPITQGRASSAGVYRLTGTARLEDDILPWSIMLKAIYAESRSAFAGNNATDDPTHTFYWKREALLYQSGLFEHLPEGFAAPRRYQIDMQPNASRIWMEDVCEDVGELWPLEHYRHVARHLGRFNGLHLTQQPLPNWPWLLTNFLEKLISKSEWPTFAEQYPVLRHTNLLIQRGWSDDLFAAFVRIWQEHHQFLRVLARLPQTLLHNDAGRKNLIARRRLNGEFETVAVDWAQPAIGAIGEDLACLVSQPVYWFHGVHPKDLPELDMLAFDAYVAGLRDMGWNGDPALVRLGYTISIVLRSGFGIFLFDWSARDEATRRFIEHGIGRPMEEIVDVMRGLRSFLMARADEARQLMTRLNNSVT